MKMDHYLKNISAVYPEAGFLPSWKVNFATANQEYGDP